MSHKERQEGFLESDRSVAGVLRVLGTRPGAQVLLALGQGPLRTKQLTQRVAGLSARSVYRCVERLEGYGLIDRLREPGVPSRTLVRLTDPSGRSLYRLLRQYPSVRDDWPEGSLYHLAELWEAGFVEELSHRPRSLIELAEIPHSLTYHQVKRRTGLATTTGLLELGPRKGNHRHYSLTAEGRRCMALVCGIGRWRRRHVLADGLPGLESGEMATVLRTVLPLTVLPDHAGRRLDLAIATTNEYGYRDTEVLRGLVGGDGKIGLGAEEAQPADGVASATVNIWFAALLDDKRGRFRVGGDIELVDSCLKQMHEVLWSANGRSAATRSSSSASGG